MENEILAAAQNPDYKSEIVRIVRSSLAPAVMREKILDYHENDIADALALLKKEERLKLYSVLDIETLSNTLEYREEEDRNTYFAELSIRRRAQVLSHTEVATALEYLRSLDRQERSVIIDLLDEETKTEIGFLSSFDEDEIGSRMTTNYISVGRYLTVRQAMEELIAQAADNDNISTIYVVDENDVFCGAIDLKDLIIARQYTDLDDIIITSYPYVYAEELITDCIERLKDYSEDSIPVLDRDNVLRGVLTAQVLTELVDDEMGEDYARLAGLTAEEDLQEPLKESIHKRLPWLLVLLCLGLVVSTVVGMFEKVMAGLTIIVAFQSLILDMAGNVGTQSLAVTIRVLMDDEVSGRQKLYLVGKEARVGLINGLILGCLSFIVIGAYLRFLKGEPVSTAFSVSFCTGVALMVSMLLSSVSGTVVPITFKKLNIDPAVASGPLITTLNDLVAVVVYYGLAWILLINVMGI